MGGSSASRQLATFVAGKRPHWVHGRGPLLLGLDLLAWVVGFAATARVIAAVGGTQTAVFNVITFTVVVGVTQAFVGHFTGIYSGKFRIGTHDELTAICATWIAAVATTSGLELVVNSGLWMAEIPVVYRSLVALAVMLLPRLVWRLAIDRSLRPTGSDIRRVVVFGAGEGGYLDRAQHAHRSEQQVAPRRAARR